MSWLYTANQFDQKTCQSFKIIDFMIFCMFSERDKTQITEERKKLGLGDSTYLILPLNLTNEY